MLAFISENLATIIISAVLLGCFTLAIRKVAKDRKNPGHNCSSCGGHCPGCQTGNLHKQE